MTRWIAHVDMDCFFAACEIKKNPSLKGKPVIVGSLPTDRRGVVCTASYEARKFGVHSALPISQAFKRCPQGIYIRPDFATYRQVSEQIMQILSEFAHRMQQRSVDEAYLDITHLIDERDESKSPLEIGRLIRKIIYQRTGYTASVGIAQSTVAAKIASGYTKPHGVTVVKNQKNFLENMKIGKIPGIGEKSEIKFTQLGIKTVGDFANKNIFDVIDNFGNYGIELWKIARGIDYSDFQVGGLEKSISREETFEYDLTDRKSLVEIVDQLAKQLTVDLGQTMFKTISIKVRYADFTTISKSTSTKFPSTNTDLIKELALQLLDEHVDYNRPVRLCGIKISNLEHSQAKQLSLCTFLVAPV